MATGMEEKKGEKEKEKMAGKEEKKEDEKEKEKTEGKKEEKEKGKTKDDEKKDGEVITAIYKINLHCEECGRKIKKHLMVTQGVQNVDMDIEKGEIKAKGKIDPLKILKLIKDKSKKKVELISPKIKVKENPPAEKKPKEIKEPIIRIVTVKVHMHCDKCERDLRNRLIKHKGIFSVKTDQKAKTVTIEGTIEPEKLISFMRKRVHKNAEIISSKEEKKGEKKEKGKEEGKSSEATQGKDGVKSAGEATKGKEDGKSGTGESTKGKGDGKSGESIKEKGEGKSGAGESAKDKGDGKSGTGESTKGKGDGKSGESIKEKGEGKSGAGESAKDKGDGKSGESFKEKGEGKSSETTKIIEIQEDSKVEIRVKDNVPYIIHYVYAPQLFSDENPNACSIL